MKSREADRGTINVDSSEKRIEPYRITSISVIVIISFHFKSTTTTTSVKDFGDSFGTCYSSRVGGTRIIK
jgi:hypothetical protein